MAEMGTISGREKRNKSKLSQIEECPAYPAPGSHAVWQQWGAMAVIGEDWHGTDLGFSRLV